MTLNPLTDNILAAIAKLGGLNRAEAAAQGIDPANFNLRGHQFYRVFTKAGRSFDDLAEVLAQDGYPVENELGKGDANVLLDTLSLALSGVNVMTPAGLVAAFESEQAELAARDAAWLDAVYADAEEAELDTANAAEQAAAALLAQAVLSLGEDRATAIYEQVCITTTDLEPHEFLAALEEAFNETESTEGESHRTEAGPVAASAPVFTLAISTTAIVATSDTASAASQAVAEQRTYADRISPLFTLTAPALAPQPRRSLDLFAAAPPPARAPAIRGPVAGRGLANRRPARIPPDCTSSPATTADRRRLAR
jgi:hypothetical protein